MSNLNPCCCGLPTSAPLSPPLLSSLPATPHPLLDRNFMTRCSTGSFLSSLSGHSFSDSSFSSHLLEGGCSPSFCFYPSCLQTYSSLISSISWPSALHLGVSSLSQHLKADFVFSCPLPTASSSTVFLQSCTLCFHFKVTVYSG